MKIQMSENIGRWVAVLIVIPFLVCMSLMLYNNKENGLFVGNCLICLAVIFLVYESLWLMGILWH